MDRLRNYSISFKGLKEGKHLFSYEIGAEFFELFEQPLVEKGSIKAEVELNKSSALLTLTFKVKGEIETVCDNCLEALTLPVENESLMYVKFGEEYSEPTEEIIVLPQDEHEINVATGFPSNPRNQGLASPAKCCVRHIHGSLEKQIIKPRKKRRI